MGTWKRLKVETFERWHVGTCNWRSRWACDARSVSCSVFIDDDPPFVGWDDADAATVVGTSCPLPMSIILVAPLKNGKINPTIFLQICKVEGWKGGRLEEWKDGRLVYW